MIDFTCTSECLHMRADLKLQYELLSVHSVCCLKVLGKSVGG